MKILNVGCGYDTYGTDFIDLYPKRKEVKPYNADEDAIPYPDNTFDIVYSRCVLEHVRNQGLFFSEMKRVLKPKGKLILITDNALYWGWHFNKVHKGGYDGEHGEFDYHYSLFTMKHLENHATQQEFKHITIHYEKIPTARIITKIITSIMPLDAQHPRIKMECVK